MTATLLAPRRSWHATKRTLWLLLMLPFAVGCGSGSVTSVHKVNGVTITIHHAGSDKEIIGKTDKLGSSWSDGLMTYGLERDHIVLDTKNYGGVTPGDEVVIEAGKVSVNGEMREPK